MKKFAALFVSLVSVLVFALTGCSNGDTFTEKSYSNGETVIKKVTVQVTDRELEVSASEDNQIYIDYFDGEKEYLDITVSESNELTVKLVFNKEWTDFVGTKASAKYRKIKIKVPNDLLTAFSATTTNENIKINALSFKETVNLDTNGGNVVCERVNVGKTISLTAKNGDIVVALVEDSATVKTFYKENGHYRLQPENDSMNPIIVDEVTILGKVFGVFRLFL